MAHSGGLAARVLELGAAGYHDREIAACLTAEGYRSARRPRIPDTVPLGPIRSLLAQLMMPS